jgi:hypothetical protein
MLRGARATSNCRASGIAPAAHVEAVERKLAALPLADEQQVAVSPKLAAAKPDVLRLAEEHLEVGKEWPKRAGPAFGGS